MGIDITEIAQKVLDNNTNAANVFRKMYDLHYNPNPLDVPLEYIDENGNKVTTNVPNRSKIKGDFDAWKNSLECYCNVNRNTQGENHTAGDKFGIVGEITENKGFYAEIGDEDLLSGSYLVVPKDGFYLVVLNGYKWGTDDKHGRLKLKAKDIDGNEYELTFVDFNNTTNDEYKISASRICYLKQGYKIFYEIWGSDVSLYHAPEHTEATFILLP